MSKRALVVIAAVAIIAVAVGSYAITRTNANRYTEQQFIEDMIPHHGDAIAMGHMAEERSTSPAIRTMAAAITDAQQKQITDMRGWYKDWYGKDVPKRSNSRQLQDAEDFDQEFIRQMIPHHEEAIEMANRMKPFAKHDEIKRLVDDIVRTQSAEIDQLKAYQQFGIPAESGRASDHDEHCDAVAAC